MKILRYVKKGNNNYQIEFDNGLCVKLNEDLILKYNLLYKKEMNQDEVNKLILLNNKYDIYNKCVKYICVRLRSINELKEYMHRQGIDDEYMEEIIEKLVKNGLVDDRKFALAFTKDKMKFSTMGPYKIEMELKKHKIDDKIIYESIHSITYEEIVEKINKQINKLIKSNRGKSNLRNRIYNNLLSLGYSSDMIVANISKYNLTV